MNAVSDALGFKHEASAKVAALDAFAWAADVDIDLIIAPFLGDFSDSGELFGVIATCLKHEGMFLCVVAKQVFTIAVDDGARGDHFGPQECASRDGPQEVTKVSIGALHHGSDADGMCDGGAWDRHGFVGRCWGRSLS